MKDVIAAARKSLKYHTPVYLHQIRWSDYSTGQFYFNCPVNHVYDFNLTFDCHDNVGLSSTTIHEIAQFLAKCMSDDDANNLGYVC